MDTNLVLPLGPDRCRVVFDFYFADTEGGRRAVHREQHRGGAPGAAGGRGHLRGGAARAAAAARIAGPFSVKREAAGITSISCWRGGCRRARRRKQGNERSGENPPIACARIGLFYGLAAYVLWGIVPIYFKAIRAGLPRGRNAGPPHRLVGRASCGRAGRYGSSKQLVGRFCDLQAINCSCSAPSLSPATGTFTSIA